MMPSRGGLLIFGIMLAALGFACGDRKQLSPNLDKSTVSQENTKEVTEKMIHHFSLSEGWVPTNKNELKKTIEGFLGKVKQEVVIKDKVRGIISPHAGYTYSGQCATYSYQALKGQSYKQVFIMGPDHHVGFKGIAVTKATHYETPLGEVPVDTAICQALLQQKIFKNVTETEKGEHSVEIQIPFLQTVLTNFRIVPLVIGHLTPSEMRSAAEIIQSYVDDDTLVVASSDFTHFGKRFGYAPFTDDLKDNISKLDHEAINYITDLETASFIDYLERTGATICGRSPISLLMMILPDTQGTLLHYYTSGDLTNDFQNSVSYAAIALTDYQITDEEKSTLLKLARQTIKSYLKDGKTPDVKPDKLADSLRRPRGVFVTLKKHHDLRGCIGRIFNPQPLYQGIIANAINSSVNDPRFPPMTLSEEPQVNIEISVLSSLKRVKGPEDIVIGKHGVYLVNGNDSAVFLPQVAPEQGWDRDTMLNHLSMKAGLPASAWRDKDTVFYVFTAQVFGEKE